MQCKTMKPGMECIFMKKSGCSYNGGQCHPIVEQCEGCQRVMELETGKMCLSFTDPGYKARSSPIILQKMSFLI